MERFSLRRENQSTAEHPTDYMLFSDRIHTMWPSYVLDGRCRLRPGPETPVINFVSLKELLLSKNLARNAELNWVSTNNLRFLARTDMTGQQVCLQSFPRTGNTFLRRVIELVTGVYTGSDMNINLTLHLQFGNVLGEETLSHENLCWVTKSHWPMDSPMGTSPFKSQKCISIVRNPIDAIASLSYLVNFGSHSLTSNEKINEVDPIWWNAFVTNGANAMRQQT